jgi:hypothetical protein
LIRLFIHEYIPLFITLAHPSKKLFVNFLTRRLAK